MLDDGSVPLQGCRAAPHDTTAAGHGPRVDDSLGAAYLARLMPPKPDVLHTWCRQSD